MAGKIILGPQGKRKLATPPPPNNDAQTKSTTMCHKQGISTTKMTAFYLFIFHRPRGAVPADPLSVGLLLLPCTLMDILSLFTRCCSWKQVTGHDPFVARVGKQTLMMKTVT